VLEVQISHQRSGSPSRESRPFRGKCCPSKLSHLGTAFFIVRREEAHSRAIVCKEREIVNNANNA
jgi:hypothetical protein